MMFVDINEDMGSTNGQIGKSYLFVLKQTINLYGARVKFGRVSLDLSWPSDLAVNGENHTLVKGGGAGACGSSDLSWPSNLYYSLVCFWRL